MDNNISSLGDGGSVYFKSDIPNAILLVNSSIFSRNSAQNGGAIYAQLQTIQLIKSNFTQNIG